jgi:hypothetical protein
VGTGVFLQIITRAGLTVSGILATSIPLVTWIGLEPDIEGKWLESLGWLLMNTLVVVAYSSFIFPGPIMQFGYRWKRIIFSGGVDSSGLLRSYRQRQTWKRIDNTNIYHAESTLFDALGVDKPREFPFDFWFDPVFFSAIALSVGLSVAAILSIPGIVWTSDFIPTSAGPVPMTLVEIPGEIIVLPFIWVVTALFVIRFTRNYARRKERGNT